MATGGWGYTPNPFAQPPTSSNNEEAPARPAASNAYGAWGSGVGTTVPSPKPAAASAVPSFNISGAAAAITGAIGGGGGGGDLSRREAELARREAAVARREQELSQIEEATRPKNFPPLCPVVYHSIAEQIPAWNRSMIRFHFTTELLVILGFIWNTAVMLGAMFAGVIGLQWWLFSLISLTLGLPLSWWMYYKSLFRAAQTDGATYAYMRSVLFILVNVAWCVWMVLGLNGLGEFSGGIFPMLKLFQAKDGKSITFGILYIVNVVIWGLAGVGGWLSMGLAIAAYRRGDRPRRDYEARMGPAA